MKIHSATRGVRHSRISSVLRSSAGRAALMFREEPGNKGENGAGDDKLKKKNEELVAEEKKLRARIREFEQKEEERAKDQEKLEAEKLEAEKNWKALEAKLNEKLQKAEERASKAEQGLKDYQVNAALTSELEALGVTDAVLKKGALALLKSSEKFDISEAGEISASGSPLKDRLKEWAGADGKSFITNGNGGGGAPKNTPTTPGGDRPKPNPGGTPAERAEAIRNKYPDLAKGQ